MTTLPSTSSGNYNPYPFSFFFYALFFFRLYRESVVRTLTFDSDHGEESSGHRLHRRRRKTLQSSFGQMVGT